MRELRLDQLSKSFGDVKAVDRMCLEVKEGEFLFNFSTFFGEPVGDAKEFELFPIKKFRNLILEVFITDGLILTDDEDEFVGKFLPFFHGKGVGIH